MKRLVWFFVMVFAFWQSNAGAQTIPPHFGMEVPGIHAYADWPSVVAGETVNLRVSASVPYRMQVVRLGTSVDDPASDTVFAEFAGAPKVQPIHLGSYIHIANGLPADEPITALTLECWVRPWYLDWAGLITQYDFNHGGFSLWLQPDGKIGFYLGNGGEFNYRNEHLTEPMVTTGSWYHLAAVWDGQEKSVWVNGRVVGRWPWSGQVKAGPAPLRLGARGVNGLAVDFADADLALPVIHKRALSKEEITARFLDQGQTLPSGKDVLAVWPLNEERGEIVADVSGNNRQGRIINHGQWMIGGPGFNAEAVPRFGAYKPSADQTRGHSLRLSSDDIYDCRWEVTHQYQVPVSAKPGMYAARFIYDWEGRTCFYHVTFLVRARPEARPRLLVLAATNTWRAYNNIPFPTPVSSFLHTNGDLKPFVGSPVFSSYRDHANGRPAYYNGTRMPAPYADPYMLYGALAVRYSHLARAERFLLSWLEQAGYEYDMASDLDLHQNSRLLDSYKALVIQGHSEYWSAEMYRAVEQFLARGGNVINLSGNTMYWRVSFNADMSVMEFRKFGGEGGGAGGRAAAVIGEAWHEDGERGGLMREAGYPAWRLLGLETGGWWSVTPDLFGSYTVELPDHQLLRYPHDLKTAVGSVLGPMAVGHEADVRLSTIRAATTSVPEGASLPTEPAGITTLARSYRPGFQVLDYFGKWAPSPEGVRSEIIFWERPEGGRVFNAGSIAVGWSLTGDRSLQLLLQNVLHLFGIEPALALREPADFDSDGRVTLDDFFIFAVAFGGSGKDVKGDLNNDARVDLTDFFLFADAFGRAQR